MAIHYINVAIAFTLNAATRLYILNINGVLDLTYLIVQIYENRIRYRLSNLQHLCLDINNIHLQSSINTQELHPSLLIQSWIITSVTQSDIYQLTNRTHLYYNWTSTWHTTKSQEGPSWLWSYGSWMQDYICNQCLSPLGLLFQTPLMVRYTL